MTLQNQSAKDFNDGEIAEEQASPLAGKLLSFTGVEPIVDELSAVNSIMAFDASSEALCGASSRASPPQRFESTDMPINRQAE